MQYLPFFITLLGLIGCSSSAESGDPVKGDPLLNPPAVGTRELRVLTSDTLELLYVTADRPGKGAAQVEWSFVSSRGQLQLPAPRDFTVEIAGQTVAVRSVGFKRRALYAPLKEYDLRVGNYIYLKLPQEVPAGTEVSVSSVRLLPGKVRASSDPKRWSPAIHVNQTGYLPAFRKLGFIGYYLGSLGEMALRTGSGDSSPNSLSFSLLEAGTDREVFKGRLEARPDEGFRDSYQNVLQANFSEFKQPGKYRLCVPGLGCSFPFSIDDNVAGVWARTYALGAYHQRCGTSNALPFTRFTHAPCHTTRVEVPAGRGFESANESLKKESSNYKDNPRHTAPQLASFTASLYPFVNRGPLNLTGGHHDAGDYSKYTINSAGFIHHTVFAADVFPGTVELDNLGIPESGDGKSDLLQEAKWEADFLAKMQDADGGFYFLVYPKDREYENNVLPDAGDPQIVFPKTTSATAAAVAALAQCGSSPAFKRQFPETATNYMRIAEKGWGFLERALQKYGWDGAYQKITHYGDEFMHDDEITWAACELFAATGDAKYERVIKEHLKPADPANRKWGWWRLFDAWGCAIRSYGFAEKSGRLRRAQLNEALLRECQDEIAAAGEDQLRRARQSAYGICFPEETKRVKTAGWFFASDAAFDLAVACQLDYPERQDSRPAMRDSILSNFGYEQGCNPVNVSFLTGVGWKRQVEIVHQYAQNDWRTLPPTGIPLGMMQGGITWIGLYEKRPAELTFPNDGAETNPYPLYDRWTDAFNLSQEFVILHHARGLGVLAWFMAQSTLKSQQWTSHPAEIASGPATNGGHSYQLISKDLDLSGAQIVWEGDPMPPRFSGERLTAPRAPSRLEAEAQLPDGRRVFASFPKRTPNSR